MTTGEGSLPEGRPGAKGPGALVLGGAVLTVAGVAAALLLDPILGVFVGVLGLTLVVVGALARDWDQHPGYEEREHARALRRKEKWERGSAARDRDRARWQAHQARQEKRSGR
jgi:hypothetical protein